MIPVPSSARAGRLRELWLRRGLLVSDARRASVPLPAWAAEVLVMVGMTKDEVDDHGPPSVERSPIDIAAELRTTDAEIDVLERALFAAPCRDHRELETRLTAAVEHLRSAVAAGPDAAGRERDDSAILWMLERLLGDARRLNAYSTPAGLALDSGGEPKIALFPLRRPSVDGPQEYRDHPASGGG